MKDIRLFALAFVVSICVFPALYGGDDMYVDSGSTGASSPYDSWGTAAANIMDAVAIAPDGTTIHVAPGIYTLEDSVEPIAVTNAIRIVGEGKTPEDVIVRRIKRASNAHKYCALFHINNKDAFVANLVMHHGSTTQPTGDTTAGSAWIGSNGGCISNCVVRDGYASHPYDRTAGILIMGPGLVTHCIITNNTCSSGIEPDSWGTDVAAAVVMKGEGSRLENCLVLNNRGSATGTKDRLSTIYAKSSSSIVNCTVISNRARNCAGIYANGTGVTVKNCVMAGNFDVGNTTTNPNWMGTGNFVACATDDATPINSSCYTGTLAKFFRDYDHGDYRPNATGSRPLVNRGVTYEGMAAVDLGGNKRLIGSKIDIGCYEANAVEFCIRLR